MSLVFRSQPAKARVLFIRAVGVLFAAEGSSELTRRYVWAGLLDNLLVAYPEVCVVYFREEDEPTMEVLKGRLGRLGHRLMEVLVVDAQAAGIGHAVRAWCLRHPEVAQTLALVSGEITMDTPHITFDPRLGMSAGDAQSVLRDWLVGERQDVDTSSSRMGVG
jgi:hypothetical protein